MRSRRVAAAEDIHVPSGHGSRDIGGRRSFDTASGRQMTRAESGQADEFTAGITAAVRGERAEGPPGWRSSRDLPAHQDIVRAADAVRIAGFAHGNGAHTRGHASSRSPCHDSEAVRDVFRLPDHPGRCAFPPGLSPSVVGVFRPGSGRSRIAAGPPRICTVFRFLEPKRHGIFLSVLLSVKRSGANGPELTS